MYGLKNLEFNHNYNVFLQKQKLIYRYAILNKYIALYIGQLPHKELKHFQSYRCICVLRQQSELFHTKQRIARMYIVFSDPFDDDKQFFKMQYDVFIKNFLILKEIS